MNIKIVILADVCSDIRIEVYNHKEMFLGEFQPKDLTGITIDSAYWDDGRLVLITR